MVKLVLYLLCRKVPSPTVQTLALDHRNDVASNAVAILCGYLGMLSKFSFVLSKSEDRQIDNCRKMYMHDLRDEVGVVITAIKA